MPEEETSLNIDTIARELNARARTHAIGELQSIRARLKGLRRHGTNIFTSQTIKTRWAFHSGARRNYELQFNIGIENAFGETELRHGVAFSFESSRTVPSDGSLEHFLPKVRHFNDYMRSSDAVPLAEMRMWSHRDHAPPQEDHPPGPIEPGLLKVDTFVFFGKRQRADAIDYETILNDFDRLLPLFEYVESGGTTESLQAAEEGFHFRAGFTARSANTTATLAERELNINLKHNSLKTALCRRLISTYGSNNVGEEQETSLGTQIDVVVRHGENEFWYYEIKTELSPRLCLRQAFGQLMEYAYWPGAREAKRLIICGESQLDDDAVAYLRQINSRFGLPINYEQIVL